MCLFCDIANKKIPSFVVYEDEFVISFLDISRGTEGHTLVVPKKHVENIFDMDKETLDHVNTGILTVSNILKTKLNVNNLNIINNSGVGAGQSVMHFHVHLIPRYEDDGVSFNVPVHDFDSNILSNTLNKLK